uniref:Protein FAM184A/B N-terminal domain-containing protein n=1 Tax=Leptobrachium leishanense TaxID=445787 RepID=A0A8C5LPT7_9ANUR
MASGKNHQPGTTNGLKANHLASEGYTQELHIKMCKKIAQLTKVIFLLNHKIDDYEMNIQDLKEAHGEELDLISAEMKEKCLQYELKVGEHESLQSRIKDLQEALEKNNTTKEQAMAELALCQIQAEEKESIAKSQHEKKMAALSKEMLSMKNDFENRLRMLTEEADSLRKERKACEKDRPPDNIVERLNKEVCTLREEVENLKAQQKMTMEEHGRKVGKLHSSYSKERENLRKALHQSVSEMIQQIQQKEQDQRKSILAKEETLQHDVKQLKREIITKTEDILRITKDSQKMKEMIQELEIQLGKKGQEVTELKSMKAQVEDEFTVSKQRLLLQEKEMQNQIEQIQTMSSKQKACNAEQTKLKSLVEKLQPKTSTDQCTSGNDSGDVLDVKQEHPSEIRLNVHIGEVDESKSEMSQLKLENSCLKNSVEELGKENIILKQEVLCLSEKQNKLTKDLRQKQKSELDGMRKSHQEEIQAMVSNFSNDQALLQSKIMSLETEIKEMQNKCKPTNDPRPEDMKLITCLQQEISEKDHIIKHLLKKKIGEIPTRVISVPNLAAYEKSFLAHEIIPRKVMNPIRNSPSLDQNVKHAFKQPAQLLDIIRPNRRIQANVSTKADSKDQEPKRSEWFTKYFSF